MCGIEINWKTLHIDHIDNDKRNNDLKNLRPTCRTCNVYRAHTPTTQGKVFIEIDGRKLTPTAWSRQDGVKASHVTIRRRYLSGMSAYDSVYGVKKTHIDKKSKANTCKTDEMRGIQI